MAASLPTPTAWTTEERLEHITTLLGHLLKSLPPSQARAYAETAYLIATAQPPFLNINYQQIQKDLAGEPLR